MKMNNQDLTNKDGNEALLLARVSGSVCRLKIETTDVFLEDFGEGKGKITLSDTYGHNYSMFWGAMGGSLSDFILRINSDYFADKLLGSTSMQVFDAKKTFREIRKFIREELDLPWYKHLDFQKDLREKIKQFEERCIEFESDRYFVDCFSQNIQDGPDFSLIENRWERESVENNFKGISEPWNFIQTRESENTKWLKKIHNLLKRKLSKDLVAN